MKPNIYFRHNRYKWQHVPFSSAFLHLKNNTLSRDCLDVRNGYIKNIHYGDILVKYDSVLDTSLCTIPLIKGTSEKTKMPKELLLSSGDVIFADTAEDNTVGKCTEIKLYNDLVVAGLHTIPVRPILKFSAGYLGYYLNSMAYHNQIIRLMQGTKVFSISKNAIKDTTISFPTEDVQHAIASYFRTLDAKLQASAKKVESLKKLKSASLVAMFPQNGESTPKVRFKGFEGEWKNIKLSHIATFSKGQGYSKSDIRTQGSPIILYGRMYTKYQFTITEVDTFVNKKDCSILSEGNEVIMPSSGETPEDIARASAILKRGIILGGDLNVMRFDLKKYSTPFLAILITYSKTHNDLSKCAQGKSVVHLNNGDISNTNIICPSYEEQQAIASYFINLDRKIALETARLEKLKQIKLACLDKMFV